ncbi:hypothetical protein ABCS02_22830 [Microbacterium sp. X-17]|uniref:hypothetical protein n=1 Tax=Microbacterium sp. X-17 TaxID=3144404 RepID=UPI0031F49B0F
MSNVAYARETTGLLPVVPLAGLILAGAEGTPRRSSVSVEPFVAWGDAVGPEGPPQAVNATTRAAPTEINATLRLFHDFISDSFLVFQQ